VLHAAHSKYRTQASRKKIAIWAPSHGKKLDKQQYLLPMSPQYGELRPTSG